MRSLALSVVLVVGVVAIARPGRSEEAPSPPNTLPSAPGPAQVTTVKGAVPDLVGRWLALARLDIPGNRVRVSPALWEIGRQDGHLALVIRFANLPPAVQEAMDRKNEANEEWTPSAEDLAQLDASWATLPAREPQVANIETNITGHDAFDDTLRAESKTRDALWVVTQTTTFAPGAAPAVRQVQVYATLQAADGGYTGNFASTTLAAAPFPIPITFTGTFRLLPLTPRARGLWQRVLDAFAGCGRR